MKENQKERKRAKVSLRKFFVTTSVIALLVLSQVKPAEAFGGQDIRNFFGSIANVVFQGKSPSENIAYAASPSKGSIKTVEGITIDPSAFNALSNKVDSLSLQFGSINQQSGNALVIDTTGINLLKNSSFEVGVGGIPSQWSAILDSNSGNTFSNGEGVHSGSYGLKFVGGGTGNFGISQSSTKTTPQRTYTYSAWVKMTNVRAATFRLGFWDEQNNKEGAFKNVSLLGTRDWFRVSMTVTTPGLITDAKNYYPMIQVQGLRSGNVYVDDVEVTEGSALVPYNSAQANVGSGGLSLSDLGTGILHSNGSGNITSSSVNLASGDVSGTLPVGNGGTGQTSFTANGIIYGNGSSGLSILGPGTPGYVLQTNGGSSAPTWVPVTSSVGGSAFPSLTSGTNTTAAMVVGTGASLTISGTGTINANQLNGQTTSLGGALTTGGAFTTSGANALTLTTTGPTNLTLPTSGTVTALGNTTTGTGSLVLATSPSLTTPNIGAATATTVNGLTLTANATGFSIAGGTTSKTLTTNNSLTLAGTDATTMTFPSASDTVVGLAATQTLTNKTLTSPTLTTPNIGAATATTVNGLTLTSAADGFTAAGGTTSRTLTVTGANITVGNTIQPTSAGTLAVQSNGANALTLDAGGAAGVNIGTTNANALAFGNGTTNPTYTFSGTGTFSTSTGTNTLNGNTTIAANKTLTLSSGTGTITQNYSNTTGSATTFAVTNSNSGVGTSVNGLAVNLVGTAASSGTNVNTGINFGNVTAAANNTFNALTFGTGYTNFVTSPNINVSSSGVISGAGSYNGVSLSSTTIQPVSAGVFTFQSTGANAVTLDAGGAAGVNIGTTNANAITLGANTTVSANKSLTLASGTGQISQTYSNTVTGNASAYNITNGNTSVTATPVSGLDLTLTNATNTNSSNTLNGVTFEAASNNNSNVINGLNFASATGYTNFLKSPSITITSTGNISGAGTIGSGAITDTSSGANALAVGQAGTVNPAFNVDASTASSVTGLNVKSAAAGGGLAVSVLSSGAAENLTLDAKGTGTITLNGTATGGITLGRATTVSTGGLTVTSGGLTVSSGNVSFTTTAAGTTTFAGSGANVFNHLASTQTTLPTESVVTYTAGTVTAGSTDTKGQFTVTTTAGTGSVTLLFTANYASAPTCVVSPASANTQADASKTYVTTTISGLTVNYSVAPTANLQTWNYVCIQ